MEVTYRRILRIVPVRYEWEEIGGSVTLRDTDFPGENLNAEELLERAQAILESHLVPDIERLQDICPNGSHIHSIEIDE